MPLIKVDITTGEILVNNLKAHREGKMPHQKPKKEKNILAQARAEEEKKLLRERIKEYNSKVKQRSNSWSNEDLYRLVIMHRNSLYFKDISLRIGRSSKSCQQMLRKLRKEKVIE